MVFYYGVMYFVDAFLLGTGLKSKLTVQAEVLHTTYIQFLMKSVLELRDFETSGYLKSSSAEM